MYFAAMAKVTVGWITKLGEDWTATRVAGAGSQTFFTDTNKSANTRAKEYLQQASPGTMRLRWLQDNHASEPERWEGWYDDGT